VLEVLPLETIEKEVVPSLLNLLGSVHLEIVERLSKFVGQLVFKLQLNDLHLKYKDNILEFYNVICTHKSEDIRRNAAYILPCFNSLYGKHVQIADFKKKNSHRTITPATALTTYDDEESKELDASNDQPSKFC
jgi:hypothetical protein